MNYKVTSEIHLKISLSLSATVPNTILCLSLFFQLSFHSYCLPILNIVEVVVVVVAVAYIAQNITTQQEEDEGGGIGKRRQGQLLCHDQVYPIRSPGFFLSFFSSLPTEKTHFAKAKKIYHGMMFSGV